MARVGWVVRCRTSVVTDEATGHPGISLQMRRRRRMWMQEFGVGLPLPLRRPQDGLSSVACSDGQWCARWPPLKPSEKER